MRQLEESKRVDQEILNSDAIAGYQRHFGDDVDCSLEAIAKSSAKIDGWADYERRWQQNLIPRFPKEVVSEPVIEKDENPNCISMLNYAKGSLSLVSRLR